jgi:hypothetical protein
MIRWRSLVSLLVFVMLATATKAADTKKAAPAHSPVPEESAQNPKAQLEKREKLRKAVSLPRISVIIGYGVNSRGDFVSPAEVIPEPNEIAEAEKGLCGDATDAER